MPFTPKHLAFAIAGAALCVMALAQTNTDAGRPPSVLPVESEPPPKLLVYAPLTEPLARGVVVIQHRTDNLRIASVFGKNALDVSPRLGHLHVTVDDGPGTWAHTSGDPIIVVGLKPGLHKIKIEIADPNHRILTGEDVAFTVPEQKKASLHTQLHEPRQAW